MKNFKYLKMKHFRKFMAYSFIGFATFLVAFALVSCNVTRTVSTQSQYFTKGDTTCTIITKTIETYDATKKSPLNY